MCRLLVGLPTVTVLGVVDEPGRPIVVVIETQLDTLERCSTCGTPARIKDGDPVLLTDLPAFGRCARLLWLTIARRNPPGLNAGLQDLAVLLGDVQDFRMVSHAGSIYPEHLTDKQLT